MAQVYGRGSYGGSLSGEHGDGQSRAELLLKMYGPELIEAFGEFKAIWDPDSRMNPHKIVEPYPITANLRLGPDYHPPKVSDHFAHSDDKGSFAHAALRCVGIGKCRHHSESGEVMCPSYMVTHEEKYSTRGRARLLFEMMHGGAIEKSWRNDAVEETLDLCLACKGCKSDCPVNVDMATYKAEFRAHYYAGRLRPRAAYSMGLVHRWARLAGHMPKLANFVAQTGIAKWLGGIAPERRMPRFAEQSFTDWFRARGPSPLRDRRVVLFPDTFNNFFRPRTAIAATRVLEAAGYQVDIPTRPLCCGRPLYDWGMLDSAKAQWRQMLDTLQDDIARHVPLIGLEPACVSAFRDELPSLLSGDPAAKALADQTFLLSEFIDREGDAFPLPLISGKAIVQWHCHHHAVLEPEAEMRVLKRLGLEVESLPSGCCGMAGSFGFEAGKYALSLKAAERVLLPRLRETGSDTLVLADGFSCREQIEQNLPQTTRHLAEAIAAAMGIEPSP